MKVSLNEHRGEIGSFYNRSTSQITEITISSLNILVNFTKNVLVYVILLVNMAFLTLLDQNPGPRPTSGQGFSICYWNLKA